MSSDVANDPVQAREFLTNHHAAYLKELQELPEVSYLGGNDIDLPIEPYLNFDGTYWQKEWYLDTSKFLYKSDKVLPGTDVNMVEAWSMPKAPSGKNVHICVVDDGVLMSHEAFTGRTSMANSRDLTGHSSTHSQPGDPSPTNMEKEGHGTAVAGVAGGAWGRPCGTGPSFRVTLSARNLLSARLDYLTQSIYISALTNTIADIMNNSWGEAGSSQILGTASAGRNAAVLTEVALLTENDNIIYVFASGNDRDKYADANFKSFCRSFFSLCIGAVSAAGKLAYYSNSGTCIDAVAPSNGYGTDNVSVLSIIGAAPDSNTACNENFGGTSSSTPLTSGIIALGREANPNLSYRDVRHVFAMTNTLVDSVKRSSSTGGDAAITLDWQFNAAGIAYNRYYGFGMPDTKAFISMSEFMINRPMPNVTSFNMSVLNMLDADSNVYPGFDPLDPLKSMSLTRLRPKARFVFQLPASKLSDIEFPNDGEGNPSLSEWKFIPPTIKEGSIQPIPPTRVEGVVLTMATTVPSTSDIRDMGLVYINITSPSGTVSRLYADGRRNEKNTTMNPPGWGGASNAGTGKMLSDEWLLSLNHYGETAIGEWHVDIEVKGLGTPTGGASDLSSQLIISSTTLAVAGSTAVFTPSPLVPSAVRRALIDPLPATEQIIDVACPSLEIRWKYHEKVGNNLALLFPGRSMDPIDSTTEMAYFLVGSTQGLGNPVPQEGRQPVGPILSTRNQGLAGTLELISRVIPSRRIVAGDTPDDEETLLVSPSSVSQAGDKGAVFTTPSGSFGLYLAIVAVPASMADTAFKATGINAQTVDPRMFITPIFTLGTASEKSTPYCPVVFNRKRVTAGIPDVDVAKITAPGTQTCLMVGVGSELGPVEKVSMEWRTWLKPQPDGDTADEKHVTKNGGVTVQFSIDRSDGAPTPEDDPALTSAVCSETFISGGTDAAFKNSAARHGCTSYVGMSCRWNGPPDSRLRVLSLAQILPVSVVPQRLVIIAPADKITSLSINMEGWYSGLNYLGLDAFGPPSPGALINLRNVVAKEIAVNLDVDPASTTAFLPIDGDGLLVRLDHVYADKLTVKSGTKARHSLEMVTLSSKSATITSPSSSVFASALAYPAPHGFLGVITSKTRMTLTWATGETSQGYTYTVKPRNYSVSEKGEMELVVDSASLDVKIRN